MTNIIGDTDNALSARGVCLECPGDPLVHWRTIEGADDDNFIGRPGNITRSDCEWINSRAASRPMGRDMKCTASTDVRDVTCLLCLSYRSED